MKKLSAILLVLCVTFSAVQADATKIAVVSMKKVLKQSKAVKGINSQIKAKRDSYQAQIDRKEKQLKSLEKSIVSKKGSMSAAELDKQRKSFIKQLTDTTKDIQKKRNNLDKGYAKAMSKVQKSIDAIVNKVAKTKGYDLVVPTSQLMYANPKYDITATVAASLNKNLPSVKVSVPSN